MFLRSVPSPPTSLRCIGDVIFPRSSATVHSSHFARGVKLFSSGAFNTTEHSPSPAQLIIAQTFIAVRRLKLKETGEAYGGLGKTCFGGLPHLLEAVTGRLAILCQAKLGTPNQMCPLLEKSGKCIDQEDFVLLKSQMFSEAHLWAVCWVGVESSASLWQIGWAQASYGLPLSLNSYLQKGYSTSLIVQS